MSCCCRRRRVDSYCRSLSCLLVGLSTVRSSNDQLFVDQSVADQLILVVVSVAVLSNVVLI